MDKDRIEDIFLTYANHPLRNNPEKVYEMFKEFKSLNIEMDSVTDSLIRDVNKHFVTFVKCNDLKTAQEIQKKTKFMDRWNTRAFQMAFEGVYGYRGGYCEKECPWSFETKRKAMLGEKHFVGPERLYCYECDQLFFRDMLTGIVEGKEYSTIAGGELKALMVNAYFAITKRIVPFGQSLKEVLVFYPKRSLYNETSDRGRFAFLYLHEIVAFSLTEFLVNSDRRKLKFCEECNNFYISQTIRPSRFCSDKCRLAWHNRKRIESGQAKEYKKMKRTEGAKASYYG